MQDTSNLIFLKEASDRYLSLFPAAEFIKVLDSTSLLIPQDSFEGCNFLILTSAKAAIALSEYIILNGAKNLRHIIVYVVGSATKAAIDQLDVFDTVLGDTCNNADNLAEFILARHTDHARFLFLTGDKTRNIIQSKLTNTGHNVDILQVYATFNIKIDSEYLTGLIVVLFSPSGLASIKNAATISCDWIAIGPTSYDALLEAGVVDERVRVAAEPSAKGVMDIIMQQIEKI